MAYLKSMHGIVAQTGQEDPANSERTDVITHQKRGGFEIQYPGTKKMNPPAMSAEAASEKGGVERDPADQENDADQAGARYETTPVRGGSSSGIKQPSQYCPQGKGVKLNG